MAADSDATWWLSARDALTHARPADAMDVLLIAALLYLMARFMRVARARFMVTGMLLLGGVYAAAGALEMRMSVALFQAALPLVLVGLLVIFQEDLRRAVERIALLGPRALLRDASGSTVATLVQACQHMARQRVGALIVLRGREPLDRHLTGGIPVHGRLSPPLLYSIFDHHSAGHDGAVVVDGDRLESFAAHLPLSTAGGEHADGQTVGPRGTRHTAALGLSERSDALVLVVSEERGEVSVAHGGKLRVLGAGGGGGRGDELAAGDELAELLHGFSRGRLGGGRGRPAGVPAPADGALLLKATALLLALAMWLAVSVQQREIAVRTYEVPVTYRNLPQDWLVAPPDPAAVSVTVSAPAPTLRALDPSTLALGIDLSGMEAGAHHVEVGAYNLELGPEVAVQQLQPDRVKVVAHATEARELGVHARIRPGTDGPDTPRLHNVEPATVKVLVAKQLGARLTHLNTEAVDPAELGGQRQREVGVVLPEGVRLSPGESGKVVLHFDDPPAQQPAPAPRG